MDACKGAACAHISKPEYALIQPYGLGSMDIGSGGSGTRNCSCKAVMVGSPSENIDKDEKLSI